MGYPPRKCSKLAGETLQVKSTVAEISKEVIAQLTAAGMVQLPQQKRKRIDWERVLVLEYVLRFYRETPYWIREGVGPLPDTGDAAFYARARRWADAIIRAPEAMIIVEGKMSVEPSVIGQLLNYRNLLPQTPMLRKYNELPIIMRVVTAHLKPGIKELLESAEIEVVEFKPSNYQEWEQNVLLKNKKRQKEMNGEI